MDALAAAEKFDDIKANTAPSATESLKEILLYLWNAYHKMVGTVETSPHISKAIANISSSLHRENILPILRPPPQSTEVQDLINDHPVNITAPPQCDGTNERLHGPACVKQHYGPSSIIRGP